MARIANRAHADPQGRDHAIVVRSKDLTPERTDESRARIAARVVECHLLPIRASGALADVVAFHGRRRSAAGPYRVPPCSAFRHTPLPACGGRLRRRRGRGARTFAEAALRSPFPFGGRGWGVGLCGTPPAHRPPRSIKCAAIPRIKWVCFCTFDIRSMTPRQNASGAPSRAPRLHVSTLPHPEETESGAEEPSLSRHSSCPQRNGGTLLSLLAAGGFAAAAREELGLSAADFRRRRKRSAIQRNREELSECISELAKCEAKVLGRQMIELCRSLAIQ